MDVAQRKYRAIALPCDDITAGHEGPMHCKRYEGGLSCGATASQDNDAHAGAET